MIRTGQVGTWAGFRYQRMLIDITPGEIDVEEMVDIFSLMYSVQVLKSFTDQ